MQRLTNYQFYVVFIYIFLVGISSVTVAQDLIPIEEKEKTQILKELNAKWDGDLSAIVTWDVHYRRCLVAYENLKKFVPEDIIRLVNAVPKDKSTSIFDYFFDSLVDLNSYEKLEGSTQTPQQMTIFRNHFRFTDKQRWEESTRSGGFLSGGRPIQDHVRVVYADDEKYVTHTELNRDAKIGNVANFHELFAYLMDFLPQPLERVDWKDPQILRNLQIFRSAADSAIIFIHERGKVYEINQSQGTLLNQTATRQGTVITQIYLFDFFTPEKNLWLPRTVLTVEYRPRAILEAGYQGTDFMPYTVHINEIDEVKINELLTESDFYVSVPKGCVVWDYRLDKQKPRISQAEENVEDVVSWMDAQWEPHPVTVTPRKNRIVFILAVNAIILALIIWRLLARKK